jgi:hypothetical protein
MLRQLKKKKKKKNNFLNYHILNPKYQLIIIGNWDFIFGTFKKSWSTECVFVLHRPQRF